MRQFSCEIIEVIDGDDVRPKWGENAGFCVVTNFGAALLTGRWSSFWSRST